jgi:hypothetical protein
MPRRLLIVLLAGMLISLAWGVREYLAQQAPQTRPAKDIFIHQIHATELMLDCKTCHQPAGPNSVQFERPAHAPCMDCHEEVFNSKPDRTICSQCHSSFPPAGSSDVLPFPRYAKKRPLLLDFSHAKHTDSRGRLDPKTGFRADCTFCHQFDAQGQFASFPGHTQCAGCHSDGKIHPNLSNRSQTKDCRGCHMPEEIENPGGSKGNLLLAGTVASGVYPDLKFSHVVHFRNKEKFGINCTTCHYSVLQSHGLADLSLPKMIDCVQCHDVNKDMPAQSRMTNCGMCHADEQKSALPSNHTRNVKPAFHNESFRKHHSEDAAAPDSKCFVCHTNIQPQTSFAPATSARSAGSQCISCHQLMRPSSHTARWRDDVHGKTAALDRSTCASCHQAESCIRCHNETPRSHQPLTFFKNGGHRLSAMLNQRACLTCHTFENTCSQCHVRNR